jgi:hypothetical protein
MATVDKKKVKTVARYNTVPWILKQNFTHGPKEILDWPSVVQTWCTLFLLGWWGRATEWIRQSCRRVENTSVLVSSVLTSAVDKRPRETSDGAISALCVTKRQPAAVGLNASAKRSHYQCGGRPLCGRLVAGIAGSNSAEVIDVCLVFICCVVLCRYSPLRRADQSSRGVLPCV